MFYVKIYTHKDYFTSGQTKIFKSNTVKNLRIYWFKNLK